MRRCRTSRCAGTRSACRARCCPTGCRRLVEEVAHQRFAPLLLIRRPGRRCRPQSGDGHDQHGECRCFSPTAPPGSDEEARPVRQQRTLDQRQCGGDDGAFADIIGGDVDQPLVAQELHRRLYALGVQSLRCRMTERSSSWLDAAQTIEAVRRQQLSVGQDNGRRRDRNYCRQDAIAPLHKMPHERRWQMH